MIEYLQSHKHLKNTQVLLRYSNNVMLHGNLRIGIQRNMRKHNAVCIQVNIHGKISKYPLALPNTLHSSNHDKRSVWATCKQGKWLCIYIFTNPSCPFATQSVSVPYPVASSSPDLIAFAYCCNFLLKTMALLKVKCYYSAVLKMILLEYRAARNS